MYSCDWEHGYSSWSIAIVSKVGFVGGFVPDTLFLVYTYV